MESERIASVMDAMVAHFTESLDTFLEVAGCTANAAELTTIVDESIAAITGVAEDEDVTIPAGELADILMAFKALLLFWSQH